jgi:tripartite-type tricarboxylate transporter receptor subunit TctC
MSQHAREGKVKALGTSGTARSSVLPGVPTIAEAGVPGYEAGTWTGVIGPAGMARPVVLRLNAAINRSMQTPTSRRRFAEIGNEAGGGTPEDFGDLIRRESAKWAEVVKRSGAKID